MYFLHRCEYALYLFTYQPSYLDIATTWRRMPLFLSCRAGVPHSFLNEVMQSQCEINMQIPDQHVGAVIGKGRCNITEVMQMSGAKVQISPKEEASLTRTIHFTGTGR